MPDRAALLLGVIDLAAVWDGVAVRCAEWESEGDRVPDRLDVPDFAGVWLTYGVTAGEEEREGDREAGGC